MLSVAGKEGSWNDAKDSLGKKIVVLSHVVLLNHV